MGSDVVDYLAMMTRLVGFLGGVSLMGRLVVGYRQHHKTSSRAIQTAAFALFVYACGSVFGSFLGLVLDLKPSLATLTYLILTVGVILGHRFIGHVEFGLDHARYDA